MRPIHLVLGTGLVAAVIVVFAGASSPKHAGPAVIGQQQNGEQPICGDAQCVPSIIGEDQFEGTRPRNNQNRRYLFPRLHKKTGVENESN